MPRWKPQVPRPAPNVASSGPSATSLACGDATDCNDVARLLDGKHAAMAFTDPPYNVALGDHGGQQKGQRRRRIENDALPADQWGTFCRGWASNLLTSVVGALYICMSCKEWATVSRIL